MGDGNGSRNVVGLLRRRGVVGAAVNKLMRTMVLAILLLVVAVVLMTCDARQRVMELEKRYQQMEDMLPWIPNC